MEKKTKCGTPGHASKDAVGFFNMYNLVSEGTRNAIRITLGGADIWVIKVNKAEMPLCRACVNSFGRSYKLIETDRANTAPARKAEIKTNGQNSGGLDSEGMAAWQDLYEN